MAVTRVKKTAGFTLIELLVVISIIGVLASVVLAAMSSARVAAYNAQRLATLHSLYLAINEYQNDHNGQYPVANGWYGPYSCWGKTTGDYVPGLDPGYIASPLPRDPQDPSPSSTNASLCGHFLSYIYTSNGTDFKLMDYINNANDPNCKSLVEKYPSLAARGGPSTNYGGCGIGYWSSGARTW